MRILLTGASGFVGKSLREELRNHTLILTSRSDLIGNSSKFFKKIISNKEDFSDCLEGIDVVIHTAARVHQMKDRSNDPLAEFLETNCFGTLNLAAQAAHAGVKRFIFLSSIKVSGEKSHPGKPFRFDDPRRGVDPYARSKAEAEIGLLKIAKDTQLEVTVIRPPLIYGPGVKANFSSLLKVANLNLPLPLGAVENKRSFVALDNLINLIICCIDHPKAANQIFHVSDDDDISTSELYTIMVKAFGKKPRLINIKPRSLKSIAQILGKGDIADRLCDDLQLDIEHTKRTLDWKPTLKVKEGIKLCASHLINNE